MFSNKNLNFLFALVVLSLLPFSASAQLAEKKVLSMNGAKVIAVAAEQEAKKQNLNVVIAVVDDGGHLIYLQRLDGAPTGSIDVAIGKARTAAAFKRPTKVLDELATTRPAIISISPNAVLLEGGVPVVVGGQVVGAVGVSGASSQQDAQIAEVGIAALEL